jgi:hypothetical protein
MEAREPLNPNFADPHPPVGSFSVPLLHGSPPTLILFQHVVHG